MDFEKTICFGTCPIYKATIYKDNTVDFNGEKYVNHIGKKSFKLSDQEMEIIKEKFKKLNFFNLKRVYDTNITDVPSTYISVPSIFGVKKVKARANIPKNLEEFIKIIHETLIKYV